MSSDQSRSACLLDHDTATVATDGFLCGFHRRRLDADTREIGYLIIDTRRIRDGGAPSEETPRTRHLKAANAAAPADLAIIALFDTRTVGDVIAPRGAEHRLGASEGDSSTPMPAVLSVVASWLQCFAEERPLTNLPASVVAQLDLMRTHHTWASAQPWIDDYSRELTELRKALRVAVHDQPVTVYGRCDMPTTAATKCGGTLLQENGSGVIRCATCKARWVTAQEVARLAVRVHPGVASAAN